MYYNYYNQVLWFCAFSLLSVNGKRDLFDRKCKRDCDTKYGTTKCWKSTIEGFTYGLSTTMVDYCEVILELSQLKNGTQLSWYNISRDILTQQINGYDRKEKTRQLTKTDAEQVAVTLLNKCFVSSSSSISSFQPTCPSCSKEEKRLIKQWTFISLISLVICIILIFVLIFMYICQTNSIRRSYQSIG